jgi:putative transposase
MARVPRKFLAGHCYHVINRGNERATVYRDAKDYRNFVHIMAEACERTPMRILAACLMPNHFHFVLQPTDGDTISDWMHWLMTKHVVRHRKRHQTVGHIWQGRFKPFAIQADGHLYAVMRYVERNALRAGLVERAERWPWGSLHWRYSSRPPITITDPPGGLPAHWIDRVNETQTHVELEALRECTRRNRPFGDAEWVKQLDAKPARPAEAPGPSGAVRTTPSPETPAAR